MSADIQHSAACAGSPRPCLKCKLGEWRSGSARLGVSVPEGWRGPSVYERERRHVQELKDAGIEFDRASRA